ncbi:MAG TPA: macro domain-containing protein [Geminicoccaceae bacterium]|nr:macro domain-containing protein [Geminicoccus sp.]HMU52382.1 macro domain-containing protein [Geminicoccaceae bacterium]
MTVRITKGDLLEQRVDAIVNTVNTVGVMGKGIALQFKRKWPANAKAYEAACRRGEVVPGKMFVFDNGGLAEPKFIINFPTKRHWRFPSRLKDIDDGLVDLIRQIDRLGIKSIAIPPLGCGNGGLHWPDVRERIETAFEARPGVEVKLFAPSESEGIRALAPEEKPPAMTPSRAAIVKVLSIYRQMLYQMSQIEVQKLVYFLVEAGQDFGGLRFQKHSYGPYAPELRFVLLKMDGAYLHGVGDGSKPSEITVAPKALSEADQFFDARNDDATAARVDRVARLIDGFETPYGMELLGTVHWVAREAGPAADFAEIVRRVHGWNARKRQVMTPDHIRVARERLVAEGWLTAA